MLTAKQNFRETVRGGNPDRPHPQPPQHPENQMSIFDVIPKEEE